MDAERTAPSFDRLEPGDAGGIAEMSRLASSIVREHYDPIIGKETNDYMLGKYQSVEAITGQLRDGYNYFFVNACGKRVGFLAFYPRGDALYLSKLYLLKDERGKGYSDAMLSFVKDNARAMGLSAIELNVNKNNPTTHIYDHWGFRRISANLIDIGEGFFIDDFVYRLDI